MHSNYICGTEEKTKRQIHGLYGHIWTQTWVKTQLLYNPHVELSKEREESIFPKMDMSLRKWTCILKDWEDQVFILFLVLQVPSNGDWSSPSDGTSAV